MGTTAKEAYDALAAGYDEFTRANDYELWLGQSLLPHLEQLGLRVRGSGQKVRGRVLDAGCGTGRAFPPLLSRGWDVLGCDISPAMLSEAQRKFPHVPVLTADIRRLPVLGAFELVLALNDVVNYLTGESDLERALSAMAANLAPGGLLLFDSNTLRSFREEYMSDATAGGTFETVVDGPRVEPHVHRQRHFTEMKLREAIAAAGLEPLALLGQSEDGTGIGIHRNPDEDKDQKFVCIGAASCYAGARRSF